MTKHLLIFLLLLVSPCFAVLKEAKFLEFLCWYPLVVKKAGMHNHYIMKIETGWIMALSPPNNNDSIAFIPDANHEIIWDIK